MKNRLRKLRIFMFRNLESSLLQIDSFCTKKLPFSQILKKNENPDIYLSSRGSKPRARLLAWHSGWATFFDTIRTLRSKLLLGKEC